MVTICRFGGEFGWGHLTRCSALNAEAKERGWTTKLVTSSDLSKVPLEFERAFDYIQNVDDIDRLDSYARQMEASSVLVDDLYLPQSFFDSLRREWVEKGEAVIVAIDDLRERSLRSVDIAINSELGLRCGGYEASKSLVGEAYAPIRKGFGEAQPYSFPRSVNRLPGFIMVGATDPRGITLEALRALGEMSQYEFAPIVVSGDGSRKNEIAEFLESSFSEYKYLQKLDGPAVASWIATSRFAIIACGSSVYELAAMGKPFLGVVVVENQRRLGAMIESLWRVPVVADGSQEGLVERVADGLSQLLTHVESQAGPSFSGIDLKGAERVFDEIEKSVDSREKGP